MTEEQKVWLHIYTAVFAAILSNHDSRMSWEDMRDRARIEANLACRKIGVAL